MTCKAGVLQNLLKPFRSTYIGEDNKLVSDGMRADQFLLVPLVVRTP